MTTLRPWGRSALKSFPAPQVPPVGPLQVALANSAWQLRAGGRGSYLLAPRLTMVPVLVLAVMR